MHIAVLSDPANFHTCKWAEGLHAAGHKVSIVSFSTAQHAYIPCYRVKPRYSLNGRITYASFMYSNRELKELIDSLDVDIVNPINVTPYGVWAVRSGLERIAMISMGSDILEFPPKGLDISLDRVWESHGEWNTFSRLLQKLKRPIFRREVNRALQHSDFITGDNLQLVNAVTSWFGIDKRKVHLNRWGVEPEKFEISAELKQTIMDRYGIEPGQTVVLSPRGLKPIYQGDIILDAFEQLLGDHPETIFMLFSVGYGIPKAVEQQSSRLEKQFPNLRVIRDKIPREEVLALWSCIDVFVNTPVYDGYSNALAEGRFAGAIPIVNDISAHYEVMEPNKHGVFVAPYSAENLSIALQDVLGNLDAYKTRFQKANRDWIEENSVLARSMQAFTKLCQQVLKGDISFLGLEDLSTDQNAEKSLHKNSYLVQD